MTEEKINIAIAEACELTVVNGSGLYHGQQVIKAWDGPDNPYDLPMGGEMESAFESMYALPNYCGDINAIHEAIISKSGEFRLRYRNELAEICGAQHYHDATARQRAEAFLRTIGKWEES